MLFFNKIYFLPFRAGHLGHLVKTQNGDSLNPLFFLGDIFKYITRDYNSVPRVAMFFTHVFSVNEVKVSVGGALFVSPATQLFLFDLK